jgi:hypothetical protein
LPHAAFPALTGCVMIMKATETVKKRKREINVSLNKYQALLMHKTVKTEYSEHGIGTLLSEM